MQQDNFNKSKADYQPPGDRMLRVLGMDDLTPTEKNVLSALAYHDGPGGCFPSIDTLAEHLGTNRYMVSGHLKALEQKGRIYRRKSQRKNNYTIFYDYPAVCECHTAGKNPAVCKSPVSAVCELHTVTRKERDLKEYTQYRLMLLCL